MSSGKSLYGGFGEQHAHICALTGTHHVVSSRQRRHAGSRNNAANIQTRLLLTWAVPNGNNLPGYRHPNASGRTDLARCVDGTLARANGGGIA